MCKQQWAEIWLRAFFPQLNYLLQWTCFTALLICCTALTFTHFSGENNTNKNRLGNEKVKFPEISVYGALEKKREDIKYV